MPTEATSAEFTPQNIDAETNSDSEEFRKSFPLQKIKNLTVIEGLEALHVENAGKLIGLLLPNPSVICQDCRDRHG